MKFYNYEIEPLTIMLFNMSLKGKSSRMRTRMIKLLESYWQTTFHEEKTELITDYAQKDENGDIQFSDGDKTQALLIPEKIQEFNVEFNSLMNEPFVIDEVESNKELLISVANTFLSCEQEFTQQEATQFDNWCERFEEVIERYANKEESLKLE